MTKKNIKLALVCAFLLGATFALSGCGKNEEQKNTQENQEQALEQEQIQNQNQAQSPRGKGVPGGLPKESIAACTDKAEGDSCEVVSTEKTEDNVEEKITGTCKKMGKREELFCVLNTDNVPKDSKTGPLPAEIEAQRQIAPETNE